MVSVRDSTRVHYSFSQIPPKELSILESNQNMPSYIHHLAITLQFPNKYKLHISYLDKSDHNNLLVSSEIFTEFKNNCFSLSLCTRSENFSSITRLLNHEHNGSSDLIFSTCIYLLDPLVILILLLLFFILFLFFFLIYI